MEVKSGYKRTEVGVIPEDWKVKSLSEVANFSNGKAHEQDIDDFGEYIVVNSKFISTEGEVIKRANTNHSPLNLDDIVMVMSDIPNGRALAKCFLIPEDMKYALNQRICSIKSVDLINKFLFLILNRNPYFLRFNDGVNQTNLKKNDILSCPLPIPPLPEQRAIAEVLSDVDALITALDKLIAKKRAIKQGAMQELLTGTRRLPGFTGEWEVSTLGSLGSTFGGLTGKTKRDFGEGNAKYIPFLNVLTNPVIDANNLDWVLINSYERQNKAKYNDLFFNTSSETPKEVGMCSVLLEDIPDLYLNSFCFGFRLFENTQVDPLFLVYFFRSKYGRKLMSVLSQGSTRYNLSKNNFMNSELLMPTFKEQRTIATILSDMNAEITTLEARCDKTRALKQGMMQELLTGRIRLV